MHFGNNAQVYRDIKPIIRAQQRFVAKDFSTYKFLWKEADTIIYHWVEQK